MNNILENIVTTKKKEIENKKTMYDRKWFDSMTLNLNRTCFSLKANLLSGSSTGIIAEFKRKSPSKGWFKSSDFSAPLIISSYDSYGAAGASILTDKYNFGGDIEDLAAVRKKSNLPLLRKDFILDEIQIQEAKANGADIILLIAAILSTKRTEELATAAKKYGMEVLLEIHDATELDHICSDVDMVGVNNRNLKTFETDVNLSFNLIKNIPADKVAISESGISQPDTIISLKAAGYKGFLIGERFMKEPDPARAFKEFVSELKSLT